MGHFSHFISQSNRNFSSDLVVNAIKEYEWGAQYFAACIAGSLPPPVIVLCMLRTEACQLNKTQMDSSFSAEPNVYTCRSLVTGYFVPTTKIISRSLYSSNFLHTSSSSGALPYGLHKMLGISVPYLPRIPFCSYPTLGFFFCNFFTF